MLFMELQDDRAVLPLMLYLQKRISLGDGSKRLYFPIVFTVFCTTVIVPKLVTHYSNLETFICSMAELVFVGNVNCGTMLLWLTYMPFIQFIKQTTSLTKYLFRDQQLYTVREHLLQFHRLIHRYINKYCGCVAVLIVFYCVAPVITSFAVYFKSLGKSTNRNETFGEVAEVEFTLHMEQGFYGLEQRTNIIHYILYTSVILPVMFATAVSVHTKLVTICCSTLYSEALLHIITLKVDNLHRMSKEAVRDELADIVQVHTRTLECIALMVEAFRPVLLMQLVFCVFIWCLMMLYFTIAEEMGIKVINVAILFFVITIETLSQCYVGTRLSNQAEALAKCVYACGWQSMDRNIQRRLQLVLHRAQWPIGLQAGKFCFVDMERFQKMANTSYSLFIVLKDVF